MKHIRTINGIITDLKRLDPQCAVTKYCLRQLVKSGAIPSSRAGAKYLVSLEDVVAYFDANNKEVEET